MMDEHSYSSTSKFNYINNPEFFISNNFNSENDSTNFDNNTNLNNIEYNQSLIFNQTVYYSNQNEIINNIELEQIGNFGLFNDKSNISINSAFNIPSHFNQDSPINTKKSEIKLNEKKFLNKKRNLFNIKYPNEFFIFDKGGENKNKRNKIDQCLKNEENLKKIIYN